jgi:exodeoxyribonuclease-5
MTYAETREKNWQGGDVINSKDKIKEGIAYVLVPVGEHKSRIAIPLKNMKLSENQKVADTITNALKVFYYWRENPQHEVTANAVQKETGINIRTGIGIKKFIRLYINNFAYGTDNYENLGEYLGREISTDDEIPAERTTDAFAHIHPWQNKNGEDDMNFTIGTGRKTTYTYMSRQSLSKLSIERRNELFDDVTADLMKMYGHTSIDGINSKQKVAYISDDGEVTPESYNDYIRNMTQLPFLSHNIGTEADPNYVYTVQPVIEMDFSSILGVTEKENENVPDPNAPVEEEEGLSIAQVGDKWVVSQLGEGVVTQEFDTEDEAVEFAESIKVITGGKITYAEKRAKTDKKKRDLIETVEKPDGRKKARKEIKQHLVNFRETTNDKVKQDIANTIIQVAIDNPKNITPAELDEIGDTAVDPAVAPKQEEFVSVGRSGMNLGLREELDDDAVSALLPASTPMDEDDLARMQELSEVRIHPETKELSGVIISELGTGVQDSMIRYMRSRVIEALFVGEENQDAGIGEDRIEVDPYYAALKKELVDDNIKSVGIDMRRAQKAGRDDIIAQLEKELAHYKAIGNNWDKLKALTIDNLKTIGSIKTVLTDEGNTEEQEEQENENANWSDITALTRNPADGVSAKIKQLLSGIREKQKDADGNYIDIIDLNIGAPMIMEFQVVYETLQRITTGMEPNFKKLIAEISTNYEAFPFLEDVVNRMDNSSTQLKNQFVVGLTNHYSNMRFIMLEETSSGYKLVEHESDVNAHARVVQNSWWKNLIQSNEVAYTLGEKQEEGEDQKLVLTMEAKNEANAIWNQWTSGKGFTKAKIERYLEIFGIDLHDKTLDNIMKGKFIHRGRKQSLPQMIKVKGGLLKVLHDRVLTPGATALLESRVLDDTVIANLARQEAENRMFSFSTSHRTGNRKVYSYNQNKFIVQRARELTRNLDENELIENLSKLKFNKTSFWLDLLKQKATEDQPNALKENLSYWVASLEPLKRKGDASRENREMHKMGEADLELARIGMLQSFKADQSGGENRVIQILYPTTSDKTTVMGLRIVAHDLILDDEGYMSDESMDALVKYVIMPEAQRIVEYQKQKKRNTAEETFTPDSKEYADGAEQFIFFPELNNVAEMWLDNGDLNPAIIEDADLRPFLREQARRYVDSLVTEKLSDWNDFGLGGTNKKFLDTEYMAGNGTKNPLAEVTDKGNNRSRAAATDMVFQYLIGNAEVAKMFTGDPALYFTVAGVNRNENGDRIERHLSDGSVNPNYDFTADAKATYINMGKRLAADIAPGTELAQSEDNAKNTYVQGFLADNIAVSTAALHNTILLDGKEAYEALKPIVKKFEANEITQDELFDELETYEKKTKKFLKSRAYYNIKEADAQEYTTWEEHLYVMQQSGEITDEDFKKASKLLTAGKNLPKALLGKVMQPMKPVFVDNIMDTKAGFERRLYIKSSSFPLLPELTRGTPLDNIRIAMQRDGVSRVAYSTAVKVGNVSNPANIFVDGEIMPAADISFANATMNLNRKGFRIQQTVPYDETKITINKVTQASKNLFINMLKIDGFKMPKEWFASEEEYQEHIKKGYTGEQLQEEYHKIFDRLHAIQYDMLMNEIVDEKTGEIDPMLLRNLLLKEAKKRNYPISDRELLVIDKDLTFLYASPSANKYESLLNSIVTNNIIKMKTFGLSYILGAEQGIETDAVSKQLSSEEATAAINKMTGITFTSAWRGKLHGMRTENGVVKPAQAIVPWRFKTADGKTLKMADFTKVVNGVTILDTDKVPNEVLQLFGMRIPNQGPNSQSWIEIVGFLPESSGDLFIGTKDYVAQMGSDFDVDKIYTYMYSTFVDKIGAMRVHRKPQQGLEGEKKLEDELRILQNKVLDIHIGVHKNPNKVVQAQIVEPLGVWKLDSIGGDIEGLREQREKLTRVTEPVISFDGGHDATGRGTPKGDMKDRAMRKVATVFVGELSPGNYDSSTFTSGKQIANKTKTKPAIEVPGEEDMAGNSVMLSNVDDIQKGDIVMLARNGETNRTGLSDLTIKTIQEAHEKGATFVVGDMPNVDTQFIEFLQYIGATFTVYHSGIAPRLDVIQPARNTLFTGLSDTYQRRKFKNATAGLAGTGAFSQDSMFNAVAQGKDLVLTVEDEPIYVNFGGLESNGLLSEERTIDQKYYLSEVISGYQSASVDNEKEQILDKIHVNSRTFKVTKILNQLGFSDEVPYFLSQDIIIDYIRELEKLSSMTSDFYGNRELEAYRIVMNKPQYKTTKEERDSSTYVYGGDSLDVDNMSGWIARGPLEPNYKVAQNDILDKFIELDGYGRSLQSVQSAINTDSKGVGKTVMESQMKEEAVFELMESPIKRAFSLIGEIDKVEQGETIEGLRKDGWFARKFGNQWYKVKPKTINGFATTYGLFTNNELWSKYFPYQDDAIKSLIDRVEGMSTDRSDEFGATAKADRRSQIWRQLKSFMYSDTTLGLYEGTIQEQRDRLLYDKFEKEIAFDDKGKRIEIRRPVLNQESLATALGKIKESKIGRTNALIQLLDIKYKTNGEPSTIEYRASTADRQDETYIYNAFVNAIKQTVRSGKRKGKSPIIGKFKGEDYTLRELAQDLVTYSYVTGGIQEAVQFVKYIPAAYLATMPFAKTLSRYRTTSMNLETMNPAYFQGSRDDIYANSPFVEQYFQHHPKEVRSANSNDIQGGKVNKKTRTFKLNAIGLKRLGIQNKEKKDPPPYLRMYSKANKKNSMLFKFNAVDAIYEQIDVLGVLGVAEYNIAMDLGQTQGSQIKLNKVPVAPVKPEPAETDSPPEVEPAGVTPTSGITDVSVEDGTDVVANDDIPVAQLNHELDTFGTKPPKVDQEDTLSSIIAKTQPAETFTAGREKAKAILNDIVLKTNNPYNRVLASTLLENVDQLPPKTVMKLSNGESEAAGTWRYLEEKGQPDDPHTMTLFMKKIENLSRDKMERVFMHELIHGLTGYKALVYKHRNSKTESGRATYDEITKKNPDFTWIVGGPRSELAAMQSLNILMGRARTAILKDPVHKAKYDLFTKKLDELKKKNREGRSDKPSAQKFSKAEIDTYYGLDDVKEFISMALTNPEFQQLLNEIPAGDDVRTFWAVLKEKLQQLLDAMGFDIVKGSILEKSINATLDLIVSNDNDGKVMTMKFAGQFDKVLSGEKTQTTRELTYNKKTKKPYYTEGEVIYIADEQGRTVMARITKIEPVNISEIHERAEGDAYFVREGRATGKQQFVNNTEYLLGKTRVASIQFALIGDNAEIPSAPEATTPKNSPEETAKAGERNETYQEESDGIVTNYNFTLRNEDNAILRARKSVGNLTDWIDIDGRHYYSSYDRVKKGTPLQGEIHTPENQVHLEGGKIITFTEDQLGAVNAIRNWMKTEENIFTLGTFADTGRVGIVKKLAEEYGADNIAVSSLLDSSTQEFEEDTGVQGESFHNLFGLRRNEGLRSISAYRLGKAATKKGSLGNYDVVVVDQAQIINKAVYDHVVKKAKESNTKVLFIGDPAQVSPFKEFRSKVFEVENTYTLSKSNEMIHPIAAFAKTLRTNLNKSSGGLKYVNAMNDQGEGVIYMEDEDSFFQEAAMDMSDELTSTVILAASAANAEKLNNHMRTLIHGDGAENDFVVGEKLIGLQTLQEGLTDTVVEEGVFYTIKRIKPEVENNSGIMGKTITVQYEIGGALRSKEVFIINRDKANLDKYVAQRQKLFSDIGKAAQGRATAIAYVKFYDFQKKNILPVDVKIGDGEASAELGYGYALPVYKSRGMKFDNVYATEDALKLKTNILRNQYKYSIAVAAKKTLTIHTRKDVEGGNSFVDKPVPVPPPENKVTPEEKKELKKAPAEPNATDDVAGVAASQVDQSENDPGIDAATSMVDDVATVNFGDIKKSDSQSEMFVPQDFVSDKELDTFIRKCKGG